MQITSVETTPLEVGIKPLSGEFGVAPYVAGYTIQETTPRLVIHVETHEGVVD
jgi:hypothetical protein